MGETQVTFKLQTGQSSPSNRMVRPQRGESGDLRNQIENGSDVFISDGHSSPHKISFRGSRGTETCHWLSLRTTFGRQYHRQCVAIEPIKRALLLPD